MGWEILGKSMNKYRYFGNSIFSQKSRFWNKLAVFHNFFWAFWFFYNVSALTFRCGSSRGTPGIYFSNRWRDHWLFSAQAQYWRNSNRNIENITAKNEVWDVLFDQMSRKKGGIDPRIISDPSHLSESHFFESKTDFIKVFWIFGFSVFWVPGGW